jgi:hypothetical protein
LYWNRLVWENKFPFLPIALGSSVPVPSLTAPYSADCLEGLFSELRAEGVLGSSQNKP